MSRYIYLTIVFLFIFGLTSRYYLMRLKESLKVDERILSKASMDDLNYGVVVDCGSSGSRLFVYYWRQHSGVVGELLNITNLVDPSGRAVLIKKDPGMCSPGILIDIHLIKQLLITF